MDRMTERISRGSCSRRAACVQEDEAGRGRKWARSSSMAARPSAACSSLKLGAASWHSRAAARRRTRAWAAMFDMLASPTREDVNSIDFTDWVGLN